MWRLITAKGQSVPVRRLPADIGSDRRADVVLPHASIAPRHARLVADGEGLVLTALDEALVGVDGRRVRRARLVGGERLVLGRVTLRLSAPEGPSAAPPSKARPPSAGREAAAATLPAPRDAGSAASPRAVRRPSRRRAPPAAARRKEGWLATDLSQVPASRRLFLFATLAVVAAGLAWVLALAVGGL